MDKTKQTFVAALVAMLVVVAGGWFLLISPQRANVASLADQTQTVNGKNASLQQQIAQLKAESALVSDAQATLAGIARRLPPDPQEANLIDNLKHAADAANVDLQIITPGAPSLMVTAAPVVTSAPAATTSGAAGAAGGATAHVPAPAATDQLYAIPLSLTIAGNYFDVEMFVHSLEGMQRAMVIDQLSLVAAAPGSSQGGAVTGASGTGAASGATATTGTTATGGSKTGTSTSTTTKSGTSKTGKTATTGKPKPGTAAGAQAEINAQTQFVPDAHTLTVSIVGKVFAMYSPAAAAQAIASAPTAAAPTPATTK
jgi:Tfp pilus assembly protein PilO